MLKYKAHRENECHEVTDQVRKHLMLFLRKRLDFLRKSALKDREAEGREICRTELQQREEMYSEERGCGSTG